MSLAEYTHVWQCLVVENALAVLDVVKMMYLPASTTTNVAPELVVLPRFGAELEPMR